MTQERQSFDSTVVPIEKKTIKVTNGDCTDNVYKLNRNEQTVEVDSTDGAITIKLPPVGDAEGKDYCIFVETYVSAIYVDDLGDSIDWPHHGTAISSGDGKLTLDAANEGVKLQSDGRRWWVVAARGLIDA